MDAQKLETLARQAAARHGLSEALVCAVAEQESGWGAWAIRYEAGFFDRYVPKDLPASEARARAFSWGVMQVMGQVAREHGFTGKFLTELCDPETGFEIGCRVLKSKWTKAGGDTRHALLLWNGGARPAYADEVTARMKKYANGTAS